MARFPYHVDVVEDQRQERNRADSLFAGKYPTSREINHEGKFAAALIVVSTIGRKHGNTLIRTLRRTYVAHFAEGWRDDEKLGDVLHKTDELSLSKLLHDHGRGKLDEICRHAAR